MNAALRRPESVLVVVYTQQHEILLLERLDPAGFWQSITGSLHWGESIAAAAQRELYEETGLRELGIRDAGRSQQFPIMPAWRSRFAPGVEFNTEHVCYLELERIMPITLNPEEHHRCEWLAIDAALQRVDSWTNRDAIERLITEQ